MTAARHAVRSRRRGAILLVVLALLALFAVIGLSFVLYAESAGTSSRIWREKEDNRDKQPPDADAAAAAALGQIVSGAVDPSSGLNGVDLARLLYGFDPLAANDIPYNGVGLVHEQLTLPTGNGTATPSPPLVVNRAEVVNFALARLGPAAGAGLAPAVKIDAEHTHGNGTVRQGPAATDDTQLARMIFIPKNAPYTYPDRNNVLVAAVDPTTGRVIVPSGHRPSLFGRSAAPSNPNWYSGAGRFRTLRPRPIEHVKAADVRQMIADLAAAGIPWPVPDGLAGPQLTQANAVVAKYSQFPYPEPNPDGTYTGDVQNLKYASGPQRNDSFWVDPRLPVQEYRGKRVAPLVAPLLIPLNGRLDLNAVAGLVGNAQRSAAGFGVHEVNPGWLSAQATAAPLPPAAQVNANQITAARYGTNTSTPAAPNGVTSRPFQPVGSGLALPAPSYAPVPWDGVANAPPDYQNTANPNRSAPDYTAAGYTADPILAGQTHPTLWNPYQRGSFVTGDQNLVPANRTASSPPFLPPVPHIFPLTDLKLFAAKYSGKGVDFQTQTFLANDLRTTPGPSKPPLDPMLVQPSLAAFQGEFLRDSSGTNPAMGAGPNAPGNVTRALVTTASSGFARPGLGVNFGMDSTAPTPSLQVGAVAGVAGPTLSVANRLTVPAFRIDTNGLPTMTTAGGVTQSGFPVHEPSRPVGPTNPAPAYDPARLAERAFTDSLPTAADQTLASNTFKRIAQNLRAGLSGVDLNRPLADYRLRLTEPLTGQTAFFPTPNTDLAQHNRATEDRQALARDIFLRLAVATGGRVAYDPAATGYYGQYVLPQPTGNAPGTYTLTVGGYGPQPVPVEDYNALRWLAQLAANLVDFLDPDDVHTPFVWNPSPQAPFAAVSDPNYAAHLSGTTAVRNDPYTGPPLSERVVFGTEKPGLVLNEVYAEIANDQADATRTAPNASAQNPFPVRFFVELLNPANREPTPAAGSVVHPNSRPYELNGTEHANTRGSVALHHATVPTDDLRSAYRVVVCDDGNTVRTELAQPGNVRGEPLTATTVKAVATLQDLALGNTTEAANTSTQLVEPNDGQPAGAPGTPAGRNGFAVVGPQYNRVGGDVAFTPDLMTGPFQMALLKTSGPQSMHQNPAAAPNGLDYLATPVGNMAPAAMDQGQLNAWLGQYAGAGGRKHAVLLQRLANPALPYNPAPDTPGETHDSNFPVNPYLTVDYLTRVEVQDGVRNLRAAPTGRTPAAPALNGRFALGRVQPFAGDEGDAQTPPLADVGAGTTTAQSLTLRQSGTSGGAQTTLFSHNTPADTPFRWLTHLDRKLVSPAELLLVGATRPHELTHRFGQPQAGGGNPLYHRHDLQHRRPNLTMPPDPANVEGLLYSATPPGSQPFTGVTSPLYRALDLLSVKPWTVGLPYGGRQPGKVNVNMLWDENPGTGRSRVFDAVMDKSAGNAFTDSGANNDLSVIWAALKGSRSPGWTAANAPDGFGVNGTPTAAAWVGVTADEQPSGTYPPAPGAAVDRPIKGFGTGLFAPSPVGPFASLPAGGGLEDTLLRPRTVPAAASGVVGTDDNRSLFSSATAPGVHPMQDLEPLRKALNSLTTVSDTYVLVLTVGFFEVLDETDNRVLGREVYNESPGDLRKQYMAVIDRTGLTAPVRTGPFVGATGANGLTDASPAPWVAELANPGTVGAGFNTLRLTAPQAVTATASNDPDPNYAGGAWKVLAEPTGPLQPNTTYSQSVNVSYDGQPATLSAQFRTDNTGNIVPASVQGSRFFVGTGDGRLLVEAFYTEADPTTRWSFNAATGEVKVCVRQITSLTPTVTYGNLTRTPAGGEAVTNAHFGNPGPQPAKVYKPGQSDPVVRMFVELN